MVLFVFPLAMQDLDSRRLMVLKGSSAAAVLALLEGNTQDFAVKIAAEDASRLGPTTVFFWPCRTRRAGG